MNAHTTASSDDNMRCPETVGNSDDQVDPRQHAPEAEDRDPEEAGYGYGV